MEITTSFPFRVGTTSFIYPTRWLENVIRLAGRVQDVELLCFDANQLPDKAEIEGLLAVKRRADLTYTVHTPLVVSLASDDEARRRESVNDVKRVIEHMRLLDPYAYLVHVCQSAQERIRQIENLDSWQCRARRSLSEIIELGVSPEKLCVECLDYDFWIIESVVESLGISVALDIGHLRAKKMPIAELFERNRHRLRVVHWHGTDPYNKDHRSLEFVPEEEVSWLLQTLHAWPFRGVLTLEVFGERDFEESMNVLRNHCGSETTDD